MQNEYAQKLKIGISL